MNLQLHILTVHNIYLLMKAYSEKAGKYKLFLSGVLKLYPPTGSSLSLTVPLAFILRSIIFFQGTYQNH